MRGWEVLILPLLGFTVWLINNLLRIMDEKKPGNQGKNPLARDEPLTDLDRFLLEARQRRTQGQEKEKPRPQIDLGVSQEPDVSLEQEPPLNRRLLKDPEVPAKPVVLMELVPEPVSESPPARATPPLPRSRKRRKSSENSSNSRSKPSLPPVLPPISEITEPVIEFKPSSDSLVSPSKRSTSPILTEVMGLLKSPRSAVTAVVLNEILTRPPSTRRRFPAS